MKDGVASRCENIGFREFITKFLIGKLGMDKSDIVTFMKGSVASRCENIGFRDFVTEFLIGKLGMDKSDLVKFMKDIAQNCTVHVYE